MVFFYFVHLPKGGWIWTLKVYLYLLRSLLRTAALQTIRGGVPWAPRQSPAEIGRGASPEKAAFDFLKIPSVSISQHFCGTRIFNNSTVCNIALATYVQYLMILSACITLCTICKFITSIFPRNPRNPHPACLHFAHSCSGAWCIDVCRIWCGQDSADSLI